MFYFDLETLLNKLVKYVVLFFRKIILNKIAECFIFIKKSTYFLTGPKIGESVSFHNKNIQDLAIDMLQIKHGQPPEIITDIFT